jgi:glycolate oxidase iron-sulfur subunit
MLDQAHTALAAAAPATLASRLGAAARDRLLASPARLRRLGPLLDLGNALHLTRLPLALGFSHLPGLSWLDGLRMLPARRRKGRPAPPPRARAPFILFQGCVDGLCFPAEEAAARCLLDAQGGYALARGAACCGAVHRHSGDLAGAQELARRNIAAFEGLEGLVIATAAGCGAALKEYGRWLAGDAQWAKRASHFSARIRDLSEVVDPALLEAAPGLAAPLRAAYDDPCHAVHAQGISEQPRRLLDAVRGLTRVELPDAQSCCGAGGIYFLREPAISRALIGEKVAALRSLGVDLLLTANPGCRLQWEAALREARLDIPVRHPGELFAEALHPEGKLV